MTAPGTRRARFLVSYLGTDFRGFAASNDVRTVLSVLIPTIARVVRQPVEISGAGRTDAGVHAWGQVITTDLPDDTDLADLARRVSAMLAPEVALRDGRWVDPGFDARFSATWRRYRYHVWNDPTANPLQAATSWHVHQPLALPLMRAAIAPLIGEHDFTSFCRKPKVPDGQPPASMVRIVLGAEWSRVDDSPMLRFEITASAFCHQMVRSITGTLVDVGIGKLTPADVHAIVQARNRSVAGQVAPPHGLTLWEVGYDGRRWDASPAEPAESAASPAEALH